MPVDPLIGYQTDALRFDALLGKGAMGAVYKGMQLALGRTVAIKVIAPHLAEDPSYRERFSREAQTLGRLLHHNVIACHDVGPCPGPQGHLLFVMVLEFVDGWSLGSLLKRKRLSVRQVLELHRQAAEGLSAAHQLGIVHRDIKPDNIMVTRQGQAKLADFGLAKADDSAMLTQTGALLGSPSYMSPEACRGESPTPSSDLYSLGCSLFHALSGTTPFSSISALQAIQQHVHAPVPLLSSRRPDLAVLDPLLLRCLAKHPSQRPAHAQEFASAIQASALLVGEDLLVGGGIVPVSPSVATSPTLVSGTHGSARLEAGRSTSSQTRATLPMNFTASAAGMASPSRVTSPSGLAAAAGSATVTLAPPPAQPSQWLTWPFAALACVVVAAVLLVLLGHPSASAHPGSQTAPRSAQGDLAAQRISAALDHIDGLIKANDLTVAMDQLRQLNIDPLMTAVAARRDRLWHALEDAEQRIVDDGLQQDNSANQTLQHIIGEFNRNLLDGDLEEAQSQYDLLRSLPQFAKEKDQIAAQLAEAWKQRHSQLSQKLVLARKQLDGHDLDAARATLLSVPSSEFHHYADLTPLYDALRQQAKPHALEASPLAGDHPAGHVRVLTVSEGRRISDPGAQSVPFQQPLFNDASPLWSSVPDKASDREVLTLRLPEPLQAPAGVLLLVSTSQMSSTDMTVEGRLGAGPYTVLLSEKASDGEERSEWKFLPILLPEGQKFSELRLGMASNHRDAFYVTRAVLRSDRLPLYADLGAKPGTLLRFRNDAASGISADLGRILALQPAYVATTRISVALPFEQRRMKTYLNLLGAVGHKAQPAEAAPPAQEMAYATFSELVSLLDSKAMRGTTLLFVALSADSLLLMPPLDEARHERVIHEMSENLKLFHDRALDRGILPVLVIEPTLNEMRDSSTRGEMRRVRELRTVLSELRSARPGQPIIDLALVPKFYFRTEALTPLTAPDMQTGLMDGLRAGTTELMNRLDRLLTTNLHDPQP